MNLFLFLKNPSKWLSMAFNRGYVNLAFHYLSMGSSNNVDLTSLIQHPTQQLKRVGSNCWKAENPCLQTALTDQAHYQTQDEACSSKKTYKWAANVLVLVGRE
uniref:Uncharacterized protein n=1 Tax=Micrurus lemniscatus lemniscatus TaxID=129467 RepID=A0A2D4HNB8_MICLE